MTWLSIPRRDVPGPDIRMQDLDTDPTGHANIKMLSRLQDLHIRYYYRKKEKNPSQQH